MTEQPSQAVKCPFCPVCGSPPAYIFPGLAQTFCINDDCNVLVWNPWDTAAANLNDAGPALIESIDDEVNPPEPNPAE